MKFRKKPVEIEAVQWTDDLTPAEAIEIHNWASATIDPMDGALVLHTLEGDMRVSVGDWIIRGIQGEFYPCKPDIFAATYEASE